MTEILQRRNSMREKGIEPSSPCGAPDPKSGLNPEQGPLQGLPESTPRTVPHGIVSNRTERMTVDVTRDFSTTENVESFASSDDAHGAIVIRDVPHFAANLRTLRELHHTAASTSPLPSHLDAPRKWGRA